jgi:hypothetical protein
MQTIFSPCRTWRYTLERIWRRPEGYQGAREVVAFIGLNPSTADEVKNDPTVTRCINYARRWGFHGMFMLNIFALRSTDPRALYRHPDPIGPETDRYLTEVVQRREVSLVVAAWGNHGALLSRGWDVIGLVRNSGVNLYRLGELTKEGQPRHPLYLKADLKPVQL